MKLQTRTIPSAGGPKSSRWKQSHGGPASLSPVAAPVHYHRGNLPDPRARLIALYMGTGLGTMVFGGQDGSVGT